MAKKKAFLLRIRPDFAEALQRWADDEFRSLNGHIEYLLRNALRGAGRLPDPKGRQQEKHTEGTND